MKRGDSKKRGWGGSRPGAGRKRKGKELAESRTRVVRVSLDMAAKIKSGKIEGVLAAIEDWEQLIKESSPTSPRWQKAREMMRDIQEAMSD